MKIHYAIAVWLLSAVLAGCSSEGEDVREAVSTIRVMSFNVRMTTDADTGDLSWESRKGPCVNMMRDVIPDVVGMQEPRPEQRAWFAEQLPEYEQLFIEPTAEHPEAGNGHELLLFLKSKHTLVDWGYYWLSATPDVPTLPWNTIDNNYRTTLWVRLKENASQKEFYFFTTHLPYMAGNDEARLLCARLNVAKMKEIAGRYATIFIAGDMNCSYAADDKRRVCLAPYYEWMWSGRDTAPDTDSEYSFNSYQEEAKSTWNYDHIFYRQATPVCFRTVVSPDYGVRFISDHYPIVLTAEF